MIEEHTSMWDQDTSIASITSIVRDDASHWPDVLARFEAWLLSTSRSDGTIRLRMRHVAALARVVNPIHADQEHIEAALFRARRLAPETRKSMLASWRVFYRWAVARRVLAHDPTLEVESVRVPIKVPRVAADDEVLAGLARADVRGRAMILLARYACLRLSELTQLHTRDREGDMLRIRGKGGRERLVGINDDLAAVLDEIEREQGRGWYFPGLVRDHMHPQSVHKIIYRLTGTNPHSLRHAGATAAYRATGDLRGVQDMLGHASLATTQRYLHLDNDARRRVAAGTAIDRMVPSLAA